MDKDRVKVFADKVYADMAGAMGVGMAVGVKATRPSAPCMERGPNSGKAMSHIPDMVDDANRAADRGSLEICNKG